MNRLDSITPNQYQALGELRRRLFDEFDIEAVILYGSVARGEADEESDLDLLIVTAQPLMRLARHEITDMVFEVNLLYGTNFSTLVVDRNSWEAGVFFGFASARRNSQGWYQVMSIEELPAGVVR